MVAQFEQALANLLTALAEAGGSPADLASLTIYIVDMDDYRAHAREIGAVWKRLVGTRLPRDGRHRGLPALGRRGAGRGAGLRGAAVVPFSASRRRVVDLMFAASSICAGVNSTTVSYVLSAPVWPTVPAMAAIASWLGASTMATMSSDPNVK